ncbi:serine/threonine-protein kinase [Nonomuraea soli]|uniref:non-specific serine/threonine protein kinase n=1 Tax=Nonomuraea soli TaxID=1032476 RepID=A0A7W0CR24_9ACTN|nr:serine/threonine-protein kinase [Nonomuraea soli]MBA2895682.1 hypothetical protein [Nonomuraea soli]
MPEQHRGRLLADRYELLVPLGRGTMGTVWRARDRALGREVAVKEIRQDPGLTEEQRAELRERMVREGRTASRINHRSVAAIYDVLVHEGCPWIIMELVEARSLEQVIDEEGPLPPRLVAELGVDLLGALRAAHSQGITHRDVKPGNVLITEHGRVVLTDFGIAKSEGDTKLTKTGMVIGSPGYTAPERARGEYTGPESDIWSLGATLYFAVEGRPAYERASISETLAALMTESVDPPTQAGPLRAVLDGMLQKDHQRRVTAAKAETMLRMVADTPTHEFPAIEDQVSGTAWPSEGGGAPAEPQHTGGAFGRPAAESGHRLGAFGPPQPAHPGHGTPGGQAAAAQGGYGTTGGQDPHGAAGEQGGWGAAGVQGGHGTTGGQDPHGATSTQSGHGAPGRQDTRGATGTQSGHGTAQGGHGVAGGQGGQGAAGAQGGPGGRPGQGGAVSGGVRQGGGGRQPDGGRSEQEDWPSPFDPGQDPDRTVTVMRPRAPLPQQPPPVRADEAGVAGDADDAGEVTRVVKPHPMGQQVYPTPQQQHQHYPQPQPPQPAESRGLGTDLFAIAGEQQPPKKASRTGMFVLMAIAAAAAVIIAVLVLTALRG